MTRINLRPIPTADPTQRTIFEGTTGDPVVVGDGTDDEWTCGRCGHVLARGVAVEQIQNIVFRCRCGTDNETWDITSN